MTSERDPKRLQFIIDGAPVGIIQLNEKRFVLEANTAFQQFIGFTLDELRGKTLFDLTHPEDVEASLRVSENLAKPGYRIRRLEKRYIRKDGEIIWGLVSSQQLADPGTDNHLVTVIEDITELKKKEHELKQVETELGHYFSISLDVIVVINFEGVILRVNSAFTELFGFATSEIEGSHMLDFIHPDDAASSRLQLEGLGLGYPSLKFENRCRKKSGGYRLMSWNSTPDRATQRFYATGRDITERKLDELKLTYSAKMASLGEMAGGIAHEINNPLAIILGKVTNLKRLVTEPAVREEELVEELDSIERTGLRIAKIIRGLRAFSRNGDADPMNRVPLSRIVDETLELCSERLKSRHIDLYVTGDRDLVVSCRPSQLSQVLMNLISNSSDAIEALLSPWIRIDLTRTSTHLEFSVEDCGPGIDERIREKMMQPFFSTKEVGRGTGLGLSISKGIIEAHGGQLRYDDTGRNTKFIVELPLPDR
jgi:PAS domain S-box-containing protein